MLVHEFLLCWVSPHIHSLNYGKLIHYFVLALFVLELDDLGLLKVFNSGVTDEALTVATRFTPIPVNKIVGQLFRQC